MQEITPLPSSEVLTNPGMGCYMMNGFSPEDMPADAWYTPAVSIGYFRDDWAALEPEAEGEYRFDQYFGPIFDLWVKRWHKRVAFRFMSENMHSPREYVTPKWVFDSGVPSVVHRGLSAPQQIVPVFWDERYLRSQEEFIADLGRYLDGRPGLEFVDIGGIGQWGEMHLIGWTQEELTATGFSRERYVAAYRRLIDAYVRAFPHTRVFLNIGVFGEINDYAALHGVHFRHDGLNPGDTWSSVAERSFPAYASRGVICNFEFGYGFDPESGDQQLHAALDHALQYPTSYLHLNIHSRGGWFAGLRSASPAMQAAVLEAARRIGYRFGLAQLRYNEIVRLDGRTPGRVVLEQTWRNTGVAPCYDSYALRWSLVNAAGEVVASTLTYPRTPTTQWWPGEEVRLVSSLAPVPADAQFGLHRLKVEMLKPEQPDQTIQLDLAGRDAEGRYDLGEVRLERRADAAARGYREDFASGKGGWTPTEGMALRQDPRGGKDGRAALVASGEQPGTSWSYAEVKVPAVQPYTRYRLSCWMKVDRLGAGQGPYLKLDILDAAGKRIEGFATDAYDLGRLGTWQRLVTDVGWLGDVETSADAAAGLIAIEKGSAENKVSADLRVSDVMLEVIASP